MAADAQSPSFLTLGDRSDKPRSVGITHVLDKGVPLLSMQSTLASTAPFIDLWKFGWGTAYIEPQLADKLAELDRHGISACTGGTLAEISWQQGRALDFLKWAHNVGFRLVEVSNGATKMPLSEKRRLLVEARELGLTVLSEVGSKDPDEHASPQQWVDEILGDLEAGARWVVLEGRESGTVGLYGANGDVRCEIVNAIEDAVAGASIIYEAPQRAQQAWLIRNISPSVNLGNVATTEIMSVESLRRGLRSDTIGVGVPAVVRNASY